MTVDEPYPRKKWKDCRLAKVIDWHGAERDKSRAINITQRIFKFIKIFIWLSMTAELI